MVNKELDKNCGAYKKKWEVVKTYTDENGDTHTVKQEWKSYDDGETWYSTDKETDTITERKDNTPIYSAVTEERCGGPDWCRFTQKIVSRDGEATWNYVGNPSKTILERNSVGHHCYVEPEQMVRYDTVSYYKCDGCNLYNVTEVKKSENGNDWEIVSSTEELIEENSTECGCYTPEKQTSSVTESSCITENCTYIEIKKYYERDSDEEPWNFVKEIETARIEHSDTCGYEDDWFKDGEPYCVNGRLMQDYVHKERCTSVTEEWSELGSEVRDTGRPCPIDCNCAFSARTNANGQVKFIYETYPEGLTLQDGDGDEIIVLDCTVDENIGDGRINEVTVEVVPQEGYYYEISSSTITCNTLADLYGIPPTKIHKCLSLDLKMDDSITDIFLQSFICRMSLVKTVEPYNTISITGISATTIDGEEIIDDVVDDVVVSRHLCNGTVEQAWKSSDTVIKMCFNIELDNDDAISNYNFIVSFVTESNFLKCKKEEIIDGNIEFDENQCENDSKKLPELVLNCCSLTLNNHSDTPDYDDSSLVFNLGNASEVLNFVEDIGHMECIIYARKPIPTVPLFNSLGTSYATTEDVVDTWQAIVNETEARIDGQDKLWNAINELSGSTESSNNVENNER